MSFARNSLVFGLGASLLVGLTQAPALANPPQKQSANLASLYPAYLPQQVTSVTEMDMLFRPLSEAQSAEQEAERRAHLAELAAQVQMRALLERTRQMPDRERRQILDMSEPEQREIEIQFAEMRQARLAEQEAEREAREAQEATQREMKEAQRQMEEIWEMYQSEMRESERRVWELQLQKFQRRQAAEQAAELVAREAQQVTQRAMQDTQREMQDAWEARQDVLEFDPTEPESKAGFWGRISSFAKEQQKLRAAREAEQAAELAARQAEQATQREFQEKVKLLRKAVERGD